MGEVPEVTVSSKNQIVIPAAARAMLGIKPGDKLVVDIREHSIVLFRKPEDYTEHLRGLHKEIWEGIDVQEYINSEREAWRQ